MASQILLGLYYLDGVGVPQDYTESYFWLDVASASWHENPKALDLPKMRDEAASHLTKETLLQTQERARKWFEDHPAKAPTGRGSVG